LFVEEPLKSLDGSGNRIHMREEWRVGICSKQKAQHFLSDQTTTEIPKKKIIEQCGLFLAFQEFTPVTIQSKDV
jgi:hypothetical protein